MNACDLVVAADDAYFASAYRQIGLTPDGGGTWSLPRIVGLRKALEIFLLERALRCARGAADRPRQSRRRRRSARGDSERHGTVDRNRPGARARNEAAGARIVGRTLSEQLHAEAESFARCAATDDFVEGISAFLDKRPPRFR